MNLTDQLTDYVNAAFTGVYVQSQEPDEAEREIVRLARERQWKIGVWDIASGLRIPTSPGTFRGDAQPGDPIAALNALSSLADPNGTTCELACEGEQSCRAWTYVRPGYVGGSAACYLKSRITRPLHKPCCISGVIR